MGPMKPRPSALAEVCARNPAGAVALAHTLTLAQALALIRALPPNQVRACVDSDRGTTVTQVMVRLRIRVRVRLGLKP